MSKTELLQRALAVEKQVAVEAKAAQAEYHGNQHDGLSANLKKVHSEPIVSAQKAAESIGVSENTYRDMKLVVEKGSEEQIWEGHQKQGAQIPGGEY